MFTETVEFQREAVPGTRCSDALAAINTGSAAHFYNPQRRVQIASLGCGVNDFIGGRTTSATIADILAWVTAAHSAGFTQVWVQTVADSVVMASGGGYAWKATVDAAIRSNAAGNNYSVVDVGADAFLGCDGCSANLTYFEPDGTHFSGSSGSPPTNGIDIQAALAHAVMATMGFQ